MIHRGKQEAGILVSNWESHTPARPRPRRTHLKKPRDSRAAKRKRLLGLEHSPVPRLLQSNPPRRTPSLYRPKGYTGCLEGYFRSSRQRLKTVLRNNRMLGRRFTHFTTVNLTAPRHPALINRDFREFAKGLGRAGLIGHWTIEVDRKNIVHWHLLFVDYRGSETTLKKLVSRCLREVDTFPNRRVHAEPIWNQRRKLEYCLKIKKSGHGEVFDPLNRGTRQRRSSDRDDIYARDRVLFMPNTGLDKHGTFGDFWAKGMNEKKWWEVIREETETVARNYGNPRIRLLVDDIHERLGIALERVKWAYCLNPPWHLMEDRPVGPGGCRNSIALRSSGLVRSLFARQHLPGASVGSCLPRGSSLVDQPRQAFVASPCSPREFPVRVPVDLCLGSLSSVILNWLRVMCGLWRSSHKEPPYRGHAP